MEIMKLILTVGISIVVLHFVAFSDGLQAGTLYECRDQNGSILLSDNPLVNGYSCKVLETFKDITDEDRKSWAQDRKLSREKWEKAQSQEEKERIERLQKEDEAAAKEKRARESLQAAKVREEEAALRASGYQLGIPNIPPPSATDNSR